MSEPTIDSSTGAVMKVVRALQSVDEAQCYEMPWTTFEACQSGASLVRALLAERDAAESARVEAVRLLSDASTLYARALSRAEAAEARASEQGAYRSAASAFLASKGLLGEFDAWCAERRLSGDAHGAVVDALWQILDDMGVDGLSCCPAAKAQALDAIKPFVDAGDLDALAKGGPSAYGALVEVARAASEFILAMRGPHGFSPSAFHKMDDALGELFAVDRGILDQSPDPEG